MKEQKYLFAHVKTIATGEYGQLRRRCPYVVFQYYEEVELYDKKYEDIPSAHKQKLFMDADPAKGYVNKHCPAQRSITCPFSVIEKRACQMAAWKEGDVVLLKVVGDEVASFRPVPKFKGQPLSALGCERVRMRESRERMRSAMDTRCDHPRPKSTSRFAPYHTGLVCARAGINKRTGARSYKGVFSVISVAAART